MGRIGTEVKKTVSETQDMVLESLRTSQPSLPPVRNQVLETISQCNEDIIAAKLGSAGKVMKRFANEISLQHPEMGEIAHQKEWDVFSRDIFKAMADEPKNAEEESKRLYNLYKPILRQFVVPKPRFIHDPLHRDLVRQEKKSAKHIGLKHVYMLGENGFYGKPDNYKMFVRYDKSFVEEISKLEEQQSLFVTRNMPEVAHSVKKRIKGLEEMRESSYMGFHRLKPTDAAIIAARMVGLKWHELHFVTVPFKFFEHYYWPDVPDKREEDKAKDEMKRLLVMKDRKMAFVDSVAFTYQPRLYPLAKFQESGSMPKSVMDVISKVEALPELNGCPAFDYYWVLMPSININHPYFRHKDGWKVYVRDELNQLSLKAFQDEYEAAFALDKTLLADGYFLPVVLGERDGKCYFLSMWK